MANVEKYSTVATRLLPTASAAVYLGVTAPTLASWRRRGIGPAYCMLPGGHTRRGTFEQKRGGTICYSLDALDAFWQAREVQTTRLPRLGAGRPPGGKHDR